MTNRVHNSPNLIYTVGTQIVALGPVVGPGASVIHPAGAVGVIVRAPHDRTHAYRIRFVDGFEAALSHDRIEPLARYKLGPLNETGQLADQGLESRVIYRCVVGSRAFGLDHDESDTDRRGIFLSTADQHWSLYGVPEQLEDDTNQECYWELQKFLVMALKANPNILECLYSPQVERMTPLAAELIGQRQVFLSRLLYQTFNGYVMSQFKRMQSGLRNHGRVKPKHVMHLMRLLLSGIHALREGSIAVDVGIHRERLLAIRHGNMDSREVDAWRQDLHREFDLAFAETRLPDRPDYEWANQFLIRARRLAIREELP